LVLLFLSKNMMNYALFLVGCLVNTYLVDLWIISRVSTLLYWLWFISGYDTQDWYGLVTKPWPWLAVGCTLALWAVCVFGETWAPEWLRFGLLVPILVLVKLWTFPSVLDTWFLTPCLVSLLFNSLSSFFSYLQVSKVGNAQGQSITRHLL
jgi:hypothetical protein